MLLEHEKELFVSCFVTVNCILPILTLFSVKMQYFALLKTIFSELLPISPLEHLKLN